MKIVRNEQRSSYVEPPLDAARSEKMWASIEARQHGVRVPMRVGSRVAALVAVAAALLLVVWGLSRQGTQPQASESSTPPPNAEPAVISTGDGNQVLAFDNGTSLSLGAHTRVTVLDANGARPRARLERGVVVCKVQSSPFELETGDAVTWLEPGEHEVQADAARLVRIEARSGSASVRGADGGLVASLQSGQVWSEIGVSRTAGWVTSESAPAASKSKIATTPPREAPSAEEASQIFARAESARLAGQNADAAAAFEQLVREHPADARAPIAALEAGRLRLRGGNAGLAASNFGFAKSRAADPFREDAHAGQVEALEQLGRLEACQRARDEFVQRYPDSPHAAKVSARCR